MVKTATHNRHLPHALKLNDHVCTAVAVAKLYIRCFTTTDVTRRT